MFTKLLSTRLHLQQSQVARTMNPKTFPATKKKDHFVTNPKGISTVLGQKRKSKSTITILVNRLPTLPPPLEDSTPISDTNRHCPQAITNSFLQRPSLFRNIYLTKPWHFEDQSRLSSASKTTQRCLLFFWRWTRWIDWFYYFSRLSSFLPSLCRLGSIGGLRLQGIPLLATGKESPKSVQKSATVVY